MYSKGNAELKSLEIKNVWTSHERHGKNTDKQKTILINYCNNVQQFDHQHEMNKTKPQYRQILLSLSRIIFQ
ncbi:CLUMA_CG020599, isoform A [Clunio marinus]|uniref:CLUMA_CG020599, isoform A n=1 Tax=Clunio marinus TaxID=568069 RepID=A0A1J1J5F0_9DIPT|nr:CLUMA_CG020599, isoform A [Clunio marinus]